MSMSLGMFGDPITPVITGVTNLAKRWPGITSLAIINYATQIALEAAPAPTGTVNTLIYSGVQAASQIATFGTYDAIKGQYA